MCYIAYELVSGTGHTLARGTSEECTTYVLHNPIGPRGGSTHIRRARK